MSIFDLDLGSLEIDNIGMWPLWVRIACIVLVSLVLCVGHYYGFICDEWHDYQHLQVQKKEQELIFIEKQGQIAHLDAFKAEMKMVNEQFEILKQQLPAAMEEALFLEALSQQAAAAGLVFVSIKPFPAEQKTFYKEHTLELKLSGPYHGIGRFVAQLSKMPRMVTFHDLNLKLDQKEKAWTGKIDLILNIKTYWIDTPQ